MPDGQGGTVTQRFVTPHWGQVTPFALRSIDQYPVRAPARAGSAAYRTQAEELLASSAGLTGRQKMVVEYWADGPGSELPPGHWNLLAQFVSQRDGHSLDADVQMFFALNNALMDAGIWVWSVKRRHDYVRPISAVRWLYRGAPVSAWAGPGLGTQTIDGGDWHPYQTATVVTPPFAEYVSGHSTFSAAAAAVLRLHTGSDRFGHGVTLRAGSSRIEGGAVPAADVTLSWSTFSQAADEAGMSRRWGGIHFRDGDLECRRVGSDIGRAAWRASMRLIEGRAAGRRGHERDGREDNED